MKIYKLVVLNKLGFSKKFLYHVLYAQKTILGIGLIKLLIVIAILALKLCIDHKGMRPGIAELIDINKEIAQV